MHKLHDYLSSCKYILTYLKQIVLIKHCKYLKFVIICLCNIMFILKKDKIEVVLPEIKKIVSLLNLSIKFTV